MDNKINGVITRENKRRYQLISSHSARRSFATINTLRNIPRNKILRATGHSSEEGIQPLHLLRRRQLNTPREANCFPFLFFLFRKVYPMRFYI